jgi:Holliday junction DNA helicase RuvA
MFAFCRGELITASPEEAVVDVSGIGYLLHISSATYRELPEPGMTVQLFTHLLVREDALHLFGFLHQEERQLFRLLLSISGVGPKLALAVLSGLQVQEIQDAIVSNRPERLYGISGVGRKTAARIILELRDKILRLPQVAAGAAGDAGRDRHVREDAVTALVTLGFSRNVVQKAVSDILGQSGGMTVEDVVRSFLSSVRNSS